MGVKVADLTISLSAETTRMVRALDEAERQLKLLEQAGISTGAGMDRGFARASASATEFARSARGAASQAQEAFEESFRDIQRLASNAIKLPALEGGGANLGAGQARAAAEAAREQAAALALIEQAAQRAAVGEEVLSKESRQLTQETRMYLAAAQAARIEAEQRAGELGREAAAVERLEAEYNQLRGPTTALVQAGRQVTTSAGAQRAGMQQLSFQIGDVTQQFALGAPAMTIFAQQGGQVFQALSLMQKEAGGFIGFMAGPWGAVLSGAVMILGMLATRTGETKTATTALTSALDVQKLSSNQLVAAINERAEAEGKAIQSSYASEVQAYNVARALQARTVQELGLAKAMLLRSKAASESPLSGLSEGGDFMGSQATAHFEKQVQALDKALAKANVTIRDTHIPLIKREVAAAYDGAARATLNYDKAEAALTARLHAGTINEAAYTAGLRHITAQREADMDALKKHKDHVDRHAQALARDAAALDAAAVAGVAYAASLLETGNSSLMAEARLQAAAEATRRGVDVEAEARRKLGTIIANIAVQGAQTVDKMRAETAARTDLNAQLQAGTIDSDDFNRRLREEAVLRPLLQAKLLAHGHALEVITAEIKGYTDASNEANAADRTTQALMQAKSNDNEIARLKLEASLIGATNRQRAVTLAQLAVQQQFNNGKDVDPKAYAAALQSAADLANAKEDANDQQTLQNKLLNDQIDILDTLDQRARILADTLGDAFGRQGEAIGKMLSDFTAYSKERAVLAKQVHDVETQYGKESSQAADARAKYERDSATAEMQHISNSLQAFKGLFGVKSGAYQTLTKLEQTLAAIQFANSAKALVLDTINTAKAIANAVARGVANAAAGAARIFAELGPWGFPVVAAMVATLAALGLRGLHGGGGGPKIPTAEDVQKAQGTGTVLGDSSAKSDSIAKSLEIVAKNSDRDLDYGNQMLQSLRSIDGNIGNLAAAIARQMGVTGGMFDTSGLGLGSKTSLGLLSLPLTVGPLDAVLKHIPVIGGVIDGILKTLFGTKKTVTLLDQGFQFTAQSVGQIVSSGVVGDIYQALQTTKKSKFFGISTGTKTSYSTQTSALDSGFTDQISLLIGALRDGVVGAAKTIGIDGAEAMVDSFQISLGKISLKDLSGDDIEKQLQAVFSKVADEMASSVAGGLSAFQKVGEGLFETLTRLAKDYQTLDIELSSIGKSFGMVGVASIGARENLIDLFGGLDAFTSATDAFREAFLSEAEQMAPVQAAVAKAMADLGLAGISTKDAFKQTVLGLDLTTEAGQQMYAQLLTIAPAFAKVQDYLAKLNPTLQDTAKTAEQLAAIAKERRGLEIQLMQVQGDAAGALAAQRADELAATDESNRALREAVYAAQDAADAQKALADAEAAAAQQAEAIAKQRRDLEIQLMEATGDAAGALAARRADELAAMDESLRALQLQVFAAQDAAAATDALSSVTQTAAEIAKTRRDLEIQLMDATGDAAGALAARRQDELAAIDPTLRALQQQVWAAQDAAEANAALNAVHQTAAELAKSQRELEIRLMQAQGDAAGVLAAQRADEIAATDDSLKALLQSIYAAEDAKTAQEALALAQADAAKAAEEAAAAEAALASKRSDLEIQLLEATGHAAEATARQRELELAAMDESLRGLQQQVWAAQDAAEAQKALADADAAAAQAAEQAAQKAADIAAKQTALQIELLRAQGHELEAVSLERQTELNQLDASLVALQQQVWAAQDAAAAQEALRQAQEAAAAAAKDLADKQTDLNVRLLRATGKELEAVALERQHELDAIDPQLRALQEAVWAAEDAKAAQDALNQTNTDAADIAKQRRDLEIQLLRAQGNDAAAIAAEHADTLAALDPSLRALQQSVWDAQAATDAAAAAAQAQAEAEQLATKTRSLEIDLMKAMGDEIGATAASRQQELEALDASQRALQRRIYATEDLKAAYDRESAALGDTSGKFTDFGKSLRDFRNTLSGTAAMTPEAAYRLAQAQFVDAASAARMGDATALGSLQKVSEDFLTASKANAGSLLDYQRDVARVANAVDQGVFASDQAVDYAQAQLDALNHSVDGLLLLNQSVLSVHDAILALAAAGGANLALPSSAYVSAPAPGGSNTAALEQKIQTLTDKSEAQNSAIAVNTAKMAAFMGRWDRGGSMAVSNDDDEPLTVEVTTP